MGKWKTTYRVGKRILKEENARLDKKMDRDAKLKSGPRVVSMEGRSRKHKTRVNRERFIPESKKVAARSITPGRKGRKNMKLHPRDPRVTKKPKRSWNTRRSAGLTGGTLRRKDVNRGEPSKRGAINARTATGRNKKVGMIDGPRSYHKYGHDEGVGPVRTQGKGSHLVRSKLGRNKEPYHNLKASGYHSAGNFNSPGGGGHGGRNAAIAVGGAAVAYGGYRTYKHFKPKHSTHSETKHQGRVGHKKRGL